jgi:hypothetical protein
MTITKSQCAEINLLLRQGAKMARDLTPLRKFDARFGERLAQDFTDAADELVDMTKKARTKTLGDCFDLALSIIERPPA